MAKKKQDKKTKSEPPAKKPKKGDRGRPDQRLQVLLYMREPIIKDLKSLAIAEDTTAYELAEEAVLMLLKSRREGS